MKTVSSRLGVVAVLLASALGVGCSAATDSTNGSSTAAGNDVDGIAVGAATPSDVDAKAFAIINGHVTDQGGPSLINLGLAGTGTIAAAVNVQILQVFAGGAVKILGQAPIGQGGVFSIKVPLGINVFIAQILDIHANVIGSVVIGAPGVAAGASIIAAPITVQTSLQAQVLLAALACPSAPTSTEPTDGGACSCSGTSMPTSLPPSLLALDVVADVNAELTAAVVAALTADVHASAIADLNLFVSAFARATVSAVRARIDVLVAAGISLDLNAFAAAEVQALADLGVGLDSVLHGTATLPSVLADLQAAIDAALQGVGALGADVRVQAEVAASIAFAATITAALAVDADAHVGAIVFAAIHAVAQLEAKIVSDAILAICTAAGVTDQVLNAVAGALSTFLGNVASATDLQGLTAARNTLLGVLVGGQSAVGGVLGGVLTAVSDVQGLVQGLLTALGNVTANLDANIQAKLGVFANVNVCLDVNAEAQVDVNVDALVQIITKVFADLHTSLTSLASLNVPGALNLNALADVLSIAEVALRIAP